MIIIIAAAASTTTTSIIIHKNLYEILNGKQIIGQEHLLFSHNL